jgi:hypothetical protein
LSVSKFKAIPLIPEPNSTISPAYTFVKPKTLAIPSPIEITVPDSLISFNYEIFLIFSSRTTEASPIPNFLLKTVELE